MKEFNFIEGQLIPHGVPVEIASKVSKFALSGRWTDALSLVRDNERAIRILERIRGMQR
ncbi:MAG TPA: hypothetical protein V6D12_10885 [Candidatus Obscuribacterales bacterium]